MQHRLKIGLTTYPWPVCLRMWRSKSDLRETEPSQMVQTNWMERRPVSPLNAIQMSRGRTLVTNSPSS